MDLSHAMTSSSDAETRALSTLLDVFSCAFSLDDIADAYIKANGDVNKAGDFLTDLQPSLPHINDIESSVKANLSHTDKAVEDNCMDNSSQPNTLPRTEQAVEKHIVNIDQTKMPENLHESSAAFGTVSSMLGKEPTRATTTESRASKKDKPLRVELPEYMRDDFKIKSDESGSAPKRETLNDRDVEEFLFCMLGEGFKLNMELIREVLGSCGYDIKKSMEELMSFSEKDPDKKAESKHNALQDVAVECSVPKGRCSGSQSTDGMQRSKPKISPGEVIEAIFTVPERLEEEPKLKRYELGANRNRVPYQKPVLKPLEDISTYSTEFPIKVIISSKAPSVNEEEYQNYRKAAKQHWDMMKQYYEKAADAFRDGNQKEVDYLIQEQNGRTKKSKRLVVWNGGSNKRASAVIRWLDWLMRNLLGRLSSPRRQSKNEFCLDLRKQDAANVSNLLRLHLKQLANIPSFDYLKVVIGVDDGSFKMGQRRRKVMKYVEKNSLKWTEEEPRSGNILIRINQVENQQG